MRKWYIGCLIGCGLFFLFLLFVPVRMDVRVVSDRLYDGQSLDSADVKAVCKSAFGVPYSLSDVTVETKTDSLYQVSSGWWSSLIRVNQIPAKYLQAEYIGQHYQYDTVEWSDADFSIQVVYQDDTVQEVPFSDCEVTGLSSVLKEDLSVKLSYGDLSSTVTVRPIKVSKFVPVVDGGLTAGSTFDLTKVSVSVVFADGTSKELTDLSSSFEGTVYPGSDVVVVSEQYGEISIPVDTSTVHQYSVGYTGKLYEGDVVTADLLDLSVTYTDGTVVSITDAVCEDVRVFEQQSVSVTSEQFGKLNCTVTPVPVQKILCQASLNGQNQLQVSGLTFVYADGTERALDMKDVAFVTDLSQPLRDGGNEIVFTWFGHQYSFVETVV